ncbi:TonB-dependent receptor [uncultured Muribaculum sp.]|uniref:SusC/RagA family TonB-linked outer membrane protein n=1 Tax=uncultured Muribaculum sp. TaxID=1918613 RepID=UPI0025DE4E5C|nr:TonB-dependent receptor [uncultured Muribaculum sp.]
MKSFIDTLRKASATILVMAAMLSPGAATAQGSTLSGTVTDETDEPVVGAIVADMGGKLSAMTDIDGKYSIKNVPAGSEIKVTYLGYKPQQAKWTGHGHLDFKLQPDVQMLEETVVIGYATVKKKDLTGAVGAIGSDRLEKQRSPNLSTALQGAIPGLDITRSGSMPGAGGTIKVRGVTTMGDSSPLILVDGTPVNDIDNVNPDDVESISVLKDAAAASIYGARAAAGVILVTTKGAKEGDLKISYNGEFSLMHASSFPDYVVDPVRHMQIVNETRWNEAGNPAGGEYPTYSKDYIESYMDNHFYDPIDYPLYDWRDRILRSTAPRTKHNVSLSYGNKQVKTRISASYEKTEALYEGSDYQRIFLRANNTIKFNDNWTASVDLSMRHSIKNDPHSGSPIRAALSYPQIYAGTYPDGRIAAGQSGTNLEGALLEGGTKKNTMDYLTGKISLTYKPFRFLTIQGTVTPTLSFQKVKDMRRAVPFYDAFDTDQLLGYVVGYETNYLLETRADSRALEKSLTATFDKEFGIHSVNVLAGYEDYTYDYEVLKPGSNGMTLPDYPYLDNANKNQLEALGSAYENAYRSFFGRVMYNFDRRYFIQANIRGDGSSRFAKKHRWGWFPSASIGWRISNEKFMEHLSPVLSNLMLRASYGSLGNERIGNYPYQASVSLNNAIMFGPKGPQAVTSGAQIAYAVEDITWESTHTWDIGFDLGLLNNRLDLTADIYYKKTKDMLIATEIPLFIGYNAPEVNAGDMNTRGWEVKVSWNDNIGKDWTYGAGFNISDSRSKMGNLGGKVQYSGNCIIREGDEYMAFYGYRADGIYQTQEEVDNSAKLIAAVGPGDIRFKDLGGADGTPDGKIDTTYDREVLGSSLPHLLFGGYINAGYKGIRLSAAFNGVGRQKVRMSEAMVRQSSFRAAPEIIMGKYWSVYNTPEQNLKAEYPRLNNATGEKNNYEMSDFWLMDGSYFRVKNINLSYSFPKHLVNAIRLNNLRVYFNVEDPFCFHHYPKGWDPEVNSGGTNYIATSYTFGLDFSF